MIAEPADPATIYHAPPVEEFELIAEQFKDIQILRYEVPGFDALDLQRKQLLYYLYEAALCGRDIIYDQKYAGNLDVRRTLEAILIAHRDALGQGDAQLDALHVYAKRVWFSNGIHHHYSGRKLEPGFEREWFDATVRALDPATLPLAEGQSVDDLLGFWGSLWEFF